jgi:hypothetical protein
MGWSRAKYGISFPAAMAVTIPVVVLLLLLLLAAMTDNAVLLLPKRSRYTKQS